MQKKTLILLIIIGLIVILAITAVLIYKHKMAEIPRFPVYEVPMD